ncbi:site-specific integrase [Syntrophus gentianae]|uniref:site-specific integrase n=1 Tax=Syntrophus gentianae TaxID=43775 RepID=UPI003B28636A
MKETQRLIRIKHDSINTERTYLQWIKRFLDYYAKTTNEESFNALDASDFKNFISHLALKERVSASTQNQAFNAILFLFRNVLCKEIGDLANTVRAKRGQRLPVVLSVEEVKKNTYKNDWKKSPDG